jgi:hypothetical protein
MKHSHDHDCSVRLNEVNYKDLMHAVDPRDLPHRDYAPLIPSVRYEGCRGNTLKFFVPNRYNGWHCFVQFEQWGDVVKDESLNTVEAARLLLWSSDLKLHCGCPSFKFYGYQYILSQLDASIVPEVRFPHIRNPNLKGVACKHLRRVIPVLGFHTGTIAREVKNQRGR